MSADRFIVTQLDIDADEPTTPTSASLQEEPFIAKGLALHLPPSEETLTSTLHKRKKKRGRTGLGEIVVPHGTPFFFFII